MATSREIITALNDAAAASERVVLATVVRVTGSSYGGVGTRMVIKPDGSTIGIVSGGCLEADLAEHARQVNESGDARVVTYDTRADDDAAWGLGLGCNGLIDVLLEPLELDSARSVAALLDRARNANEPSILATVVAGLDVKTGTHILIVGDEVHLTDECPQTLSDAIVRDSKDAFAEKRRGMVREYDDVTVAFEVITPAIRLVVCGSGPDVVPVVRFGAELGWNLIVVDHRAIEHAHPERFPNARVVECQSPDLIRSVIGLTSHTAAVVMSHHYARDMEYFRALLASEVPYMGMLGPRARTERMLADLAASGFHEPAEQRLFTPVGLDIGGEGPDAIALAIISEVSAAMSGTSGGHLRDRRGALHRALAQETHSS